MAVDSIWRRPISPRLLVGLLFTAWAIALFIALVTTGVVHDVSAGLSYFLTLIVIAVGVFQLNGARWWLHAAHAAGLFGTLCLVLIWLISRTGSASFQRFIVIRVVGVVIWSMIFILLAASIAGWLRMWRYGPRPLRPSKSAVPIE